MTHTIAHDDHDGPHEWEPDCRYAYLDLVHENVSTPPGFLSVQ